ncbi:hypothetical protein Taro_004842, partial [Colocasia esculenta]|nr:hypothetical protein [Colocasia esculenta]
VRHRSPDRDRPICRLLGSDCDSLPVTTKKAIDCQPLGGLQGGVEPLGGLQGLQAWKKEFS